MLIHMRTNIVLDDELVAEAARLTGITTRKELVHAGLRTLIEVKRRRSLLELDGKVRFRRGYDHKRLRRERA